MGALAAKRSCVTVALLAVAMMALMAANVAAQPGTSLTCATSLIPCRNYLNSTNPPEDCCKPLKDAVTNELACLCDIFDNPGLLKSFGIDVNQALKLPANCGIITASSNLCKSTAASPLGSPVTGAPPASPGNGINGANGSRRVGLWGMAGLFLIWWFVFA